MAFKKRSPAALIQPGALVPQDAADILDLAPEPINEFEKALGGRTELLSVLALAATGEIRDLVSRLLDPHYDKDSLGYLANSVGITLTDLLRAYRTGVLAKAHILSSRQIAAKLPAVVEDVMKRAAPYEELCEGCDASGQMTVRPTKKCPVPDPATVLCTICRGKGKVIRLPEIDRQRLALEIGELIKPPKGGPSVLQQFNFPTAAVASDPAAGALEKMQQAVTGILYGRGNVIDLEPEPPV